VSGGHSDLVLAMRMASTVASAARATTPLAKPLTKSARLLGLGFPGGPEIERAAKNGDPNRFPVSARWLEPDSWDFSFSGLKTAVLHQVRALGVDLRCTSPRAGVDPEMHQVRTPG